MISKKLQKKLDEKMGIDRESTNIKFQNSDPITKKDRGKMMVLGEFAVVQADLMYMKDGDEKGYKYVLTVVDVNSRRVDAIPLHGRTAEDVIEGFETVWKHKYISKNIKYIYTDPGSEFKNKEVHEYMESLGITMRHTMTARKNQMAVAEYMNHVISKQTNEKMTDISLQMGEHYANWSKELPVLMEVLNDDDALKKTKLSDFFRDPKIKDQNEIDNILKIGTVVHVKLQQAEDYMKETNKRLHGGFRHGDVRWNMKPTEIKNVTIYPNQPIKYMVKNPENATFPRPELMVADEKTTKLYREQNPLNAPEKIPENPQQPIHRSIINTRSQTNLKHQTFDGKKRI